MLTGPGEQAWTCLSMHTAFSSNSTSGFTQLSITDSIGGSRLGSSFAGPCTEVAGVYQLAVGSLIGTFKFWFLLCQGQSSPGDGHTSVPSRDWGERHTHELYISSHLQIAQQLQNTTGSPRGRSLPCGLRRSWTGETSPARLG